MATKKVESKLNANGIEISVITTVGTEDDYISLTDIAKNAYRLNSASHNIMKRSVLLDK